MLVYILLNSKTPIVSIPNTILNIFQLVDSLILIIVYVSTVNNMSRVYILSNYCAIKFQFDNYGGVGGNNS